LTFSNVSWSLSSMYLTACFAFFFFIIINHTSQDLGFISVCLLPAFDKFCFFLLSNSFKCTFPVLRELPQCICWLLLCRAQEGARLSSDGHTTGSTSLFCAWNLFIGCNGGQSLSSWSFYHIS
jgi:hypothetical protein